MVVYTHLIDSAPGDVEEEEKPKRSQYRAKHLQREVAKIQAKLRAKGIPVPRPPSPTRAGSPGRPRSKSPRARASRGSTHASMPPPSSCASPQVAGSRPGSAGTTYTVGLDSSPLPSPPRTSSTPHRPPPIKTDDLLSREPRESESDGPQDLSAFLSIPVPALRLKLRGRLLNGQMPRPSPPPTPPPPPPPLRPVERLELLLQAPDPLLIPLPELHPQRAQRPPPASPIRGADSPLAPSAYAGWDVASVLSPSTRPAAPQHPLAAESSKVLASLPSSSQMFLHPPQYPPASANTVAFSMQPSQRPGVLPALGTSGRQQGEGWGGGLVGLGDSMTDLGLDGPGDADLAGLLSARAKLTSAEQRLNTAVAGVQLGTIPLRGPRQEAHARYKDGSDYLTTMFPVSPLTEEEYVQHMERLAALNPSIRSGPSMSMSGAPTSTRRAPSMAGWRMSVVGAQRSATSMGADTVAAHSVDGRSSLLSASGSQGVSGLLSRFGVGDMEQQWEETEGEEWEGDAEGWQGAGEGGMMGTGSVHPTQHRGVAILSQFFGHPVQSRKVVHKSGHTRPRAEVGVGVQVRAHREQAASNEASPAKPVCLMGEETNACAASQQ